MHVTWILNVWHIEYTQNFNTFGQSFPSDTVIKATLSPRLTLIPVG